MKHFIKLSINGAFPSGVDETGTYRISEKMYDEICEIIEIGMISGDVKAV